MTIIIIIITGIVSLFALNRPELFNKLRFSPYLMRHHNEWTRAFTYGLVHADIIHLAVNLFVLYSFGALVEEYYAYFFDGKAGLYYLLLYVGGIIFSVLPSYAKQNSNPNYSAVGASGAVSGIVFASIVFNPMGKIGFLLIPVALPSVAFGLLYLVYSAYMSRRGKDNIGHDAHFWGAIYGMLFTFALKPPLFLYFIRSIGESLGIH